MCLILVRLWPVPCCENVCVRFPMFQSAMSGVSWLTGFLDSQLGWLNQFSLGNFSYGIMFADFPLGPSNGFNLLHSRCRDSLQQIFSFVAVADGW